MATTRLDIAREINETYPLLLSVRITEAQALSIGYASLQALADGIAAASVQMQIPLMSPIDASVSVESPVGADVTVHITVELPTAVTDVAASLGYALVFEPGSAVSERVICQGVLTIRARPTS